MNFDKIPFVANIPLAKEREFEEKISEELEVEKERNERIRKTYNKPTTNLRKIADYLLLHLNEEISYEQLGKILSMPESSCRCCVGDLNFYSGYPLTMMPIPKRPGFIQSVLSNETDYERWDRKKLKTITSMAVVRGKAEKTVKSKRRTKEKEQAIIVKERN